MVNKNEAELDKLIRPREKFFKKYKYHCTCFVGYCVCKNCQQYYDPFGRIWMVIRSWLRKKMEGKTYG